MIGHRSKRMLWAVAMVALGIGAGCKKQPPAESPVARVSVDRPTRVAPAEPGEWGTMVFPARYADPELPIFPPEAVQAQVARAVVRADFVVLPDGRAHQIRLSLESEVKEGPRFVAACEDVLERWLFSPAWRLTRPGEQDAPVTLLPSSAQLVFRFDLNAHLQGDVVQMSFGARQP